MKTKKLLLSMLLLLPVIFCAVALPACNKKDTSVESLAHAHDWVVTDTTQASCGEAARMYYECSICGGTKYEKTSPATGNHNMNNGVCSSCGYVEFDGLDRDYAVRTYGFCLDDRDGSGTYTTGDVVYFGSYPQSLVYPAVAEDLGNQKVPGITATEEISDELLVAFSEAEGTLPTATSRGDWKDYGYYLQSEVQSYMFYKDVEIDGEKYRGVYMLEYRPYYFYAEPKSYYDETGASDDCTYIDDEGYELETVYWFRYEPIEWMVLDYENGTLMLNSKYCLDAQPFQDTYEGDRLTISHIGEPDTLINDYESSSVRSFLNGDFCDTAFDSVERSMIQTTTLDNKYSGYSVLNPDTGLYEFTNDFQLMQNDTSDSVFLLSYQDAICGEYGFKTDKSEDDARAHSMTAYSLIQGLRPSEQGLTADGDPACYYMLRSAGNVRFGICGVSKTGEVDWTGSLSIGGTASHDCLAFNGDFGLLPAVYVKVV